MVADSRARLEAEGSRVKKYKVVSVSLYVEEVVAIDAKVEALRQAGYKASRSTVMALGAVHLDDDVLISVLPKSGERAVKKRPPREKPASPPRPTKSLAFEGPIRGPWDGYKCGRCGEEGHNVRTCTKEAR
jgi:hypothetical protein